MFKNTSPKVIDGGKSKSGIGFYLLLVLFCERKSFIAENITEADAKISMSVCLSVRFSKAIRDQDTLHQPE
jgi:hypothetical protein